MGLYQFKVPEKSIAAIFILPLSSVLAPFSHKINKTSSGIPVVHVIHIILYTMRFTIHLEVWPVHHTIHMRHTIHLGVWPIHPTIHMTFTIHLGIWPAHHTIHMTMHFPMLRVIQSAAEQVLMRSIESCSPVAGVVDWGLHDLAMVMLLMYFQRLSVSEATSFTIARNTTGPLWSPAGCGQPVWGTGAEFDTLLAVGKTVCNPG